MTATDIVSPILTSMLSIATDALDPRPDRAIVAPGIPAWDSCCSGQVWSRLVSLVPGSGIASNVAYRITQNTPCGVLNWQATFGVGILRCAHTVDDNGNAPTAAQVTEDGLATVQDMLDLSEAIQCDMTGISNVDTLRIIRWDPLGPDGGCVGGEWTFTALIPNCRC